MRSVTTKPPTKKAPATSGGDVYQGITDEQIEDLRWQIIDDLHATDAARTLLVHSTFCITAGIPMPEKLRRVLCDGLDHIEWKDPLAAFGHIRPKPRGRGRPRKESDHEWLYVMKGILGVHREEFPLTHPNESRYPFKKYEGTAFHEYARRHLDGNDVAIGKEARRLQSGFWEHVRKLPAAQIEALGLLEYLPRRND